MNETSVNFQTISFEKKYYVTSTDIPPFEVESEAFSRYSRELLQFGGACSILFSILGVAGNFISILALSKCKRLRNPTTVFIVNLCVSDLLFCCFSMPLTAQVFFSRRWFSSEPLCKFFAFMRFSNPMISRFTILAITINRYVLIIHPRIYPFLYKKRMIVIMISLIWLVPTMLLVLPLSESWGKLGHNPNGGSCTIMKLEGKSPKNFIYIIGLLIPSLIFIACYTAIYFTVKKIENKSNSNRNSMCLACFKRTSPSHSEINRNGDVEQQNQDRVVYDKRFRLVRIMLVIFISFTACYFPMLLQRFFLKGKNFPVLHIFSYVCYFFSCVVNPVIYVVMSKEFRKAYKNLFCL